MRFPIINPRSFLLLLGLLLGAGTLSAQLRMVSETMGLDAYATRTGNARSLALAEVEGMIEREEVMADAFAVRLDLSPILSNEPVILDLQGTRYPVIKSRYWENEADSSDYAVFGYLKGSPGLEFYYHHAPDGAEHLSFSSPDREYRLDPLGDDWFVVYSFRPEYTAQAGCSSEPGTESTAGPEPTAEASSSAKANASGDKCAIRTLFLYTNNVGVSHSSLNSALDQNIAQVNQILSNDNGLNPVLGSAETTNNCTFQLEKVGLVASHQSPFGAYWEVPCTSPGNGFTMRQDMLDGLNGTGPMYWLRWIRYDYAADLVVLLTGPDLYSSGRSCPTQSPDMNGVAGGYLAGHQNSVVVMRAQGTFMTQGSNPSPVPGNLTLVHELGHLLGCEHETAGNIYRAYCSSSHPDKTLMHTLYNNCGTSPRYRRPVVSHKDHVFSKIAGNAAGTPSHMNAQRFASRIPIHSQYFENNESNFDNDLLYQQDFDNNSGHERIIRTTGQVLLRYCKNTGNDAVVIDEAALVRISGSFLSNNIRIQPGIPVLGGGSIVFNISSQASKLDAEMESEHADRLFGATLFPNPGNGQAQVSCFLARESPVHLSLFDLEGRLVRSFLNAVVYPPGEHHLEVDASDLAPGMYLVKVQAGPDQATLRMVIQ